jgi:hypothetical protein
MTNTYVWTVTGMTCYPTYASQTDVVFSVQWNCTGTDTSVTPNVSETFNGVTPVTYTAGSPFTPYNQLTNDMVIGWVQAVLGPTGVAQVENTVDGYIYDAENPTTSPPLPWTTQS